MLCLHAGAQVADLNTIRAVPIPQETKTYCPLPHTLFIDMVRQNLLDSGYAIVNEEYAISVETKGVDYGAQLFGKMDLSHERAHFNTCLGLRNSYDKSLAAGVCIGSRVFICDNLAFIADYMALRKHTRYILENLPERIAELMGSIPALIAFQDEQFNNFRSVGLTDTLANDFAVRAAQAGVYAGDKILKVLKEFHEPKHEEFREPTVWSFTNAVTETLKGSNIFDLSKKTSALYKVAEEFLTY